MKPRHLLLVTIVSAFAVVFALARSSGKASSTPMPDIVDNWDDEENSRPEVSGPRYGDGSCKNSTSTYRSSRYKVPADEECNNTDKKCCVPKDDRDEVRCHKARDQQRSVCVHYPKVARKQKDVSKTAN